MEREARAFWTSLSTFRVLSRCDGLTAGIAATLHDDLDMIARMTEWPLLRVRAEAAADEIEAVRRRLAA